MTQIAERPAPERPVSGQQRPGPLDVLRVLGTGNLQKEAASRGMTTSMYLERQDPSDQYKDGLDAFERLLQAAKIRTTSDIGRGIYADQWEYAFDMDHDGIGREARRALFLEFAIRQWRRASTGREVSTRAVLTSDLEALGQALRPWDDRAGMRESLITPAIPLAELVAITTPITGDAYRAAYWVDPPTTQTRFVRVTEAAEIPKATVSTAEHTVRLYKYGRAIEMSYEVLRRAPVDKVAFWIRRVAVQSAADKIPAALDILINGDGNANTAATNYNLTTLDAAAVAGTLTLKGWLAFKLKFPNPYALTTALVQEAVALQLMLLNLGSANIPLVTIQAQAGFGALTPINPELRDNVAFGVTTDAPTLKVVGIDRRFALERIFEVGSDTTETERYITRQTQVLVLSETEGWMIADGSAARTLNLNA